MTHKAAYTSPENIKKYADGSSAEKTFSSKYAATVRLRHHDDNY